MSKIIITRRTINTESSLILLGTELTVITDSTVTAGNIVYTLNGATTHVALLTPNVILQSVPLTIHPVYTDTDTYFCYCLDSGTAGSTIRVKVLSYGS